MIHFPTNFILAATTIYVFGMVMLGLRLVLRHSPIPAATITKISWMVSAMLIAWLGITAFMAQRGFLAHGDARPPRVPLVPLAALLTLIAINRLPSFLLLLRAAPRHWAVGMQSFRILVELCFWGLYIDGGAPALVTFEGRNWDVLVGLSAPLVALAIKKFNLDSRAVLVWNIAGLLILGNTIFTTLTAHPGPLHLNWGVTFTAFASWPFVWIPAFLAPVAIFLHVFSIRQNLTRGVSP